MTEIKKINVLSLAKIQAVLGAIIGFIGGLMFAVMGAFLSAVPGFKGIGLGLGIFAIIVLPIMYAITGFIVGVIIAFLYNLAAKWIGGVELELEN